MEGPYSGPGGLGTYFDVDNEQPSDNPRPQQRNAEVPYSFAPMATTNARRANSVGRIPIFGEYVTHMQLTIQEEDLMIVAKSEGEVKRTLRMFLGGDAELLVDEDINGNGITYKDFIESDRSPFAVFNGLRKPPQFAAGGENPIHDQGLYIMYRFLGVAEVGGPKYYDPYQRVSELTIIPDGVVNYVNVMDQPIEAGVPMIWDITQSKLLENVSGQTPAYLTPADKIPAHEISTIKGCFKPASILPPKDILVMAACNLRLQFLIDYYERYIGISIMRYHNEQHGGNIEFRNIDDLHNLEGCDRCMADTVEREGSSIGEVYNVGVRPGTWGKKYESVGPLHMHLRSRGGEAEERTKVPAAHPTIEGLKKGKEHRTAVRMRPLQEALQETTSVLDSLPKEAGKRKKEERTKKIKDVPEKLKTAYEERRRATATEKDTAEKELENIKAKEKDAEEAVKAAKGTPQETTLLAESSKAGKARMEAEKVLERKKMEHKEAEKAMNDVEVAIEQQKKTEQEIISKAAGRKEPGKAKKRLEVTETIGTDVPVENKPFYRAFVDRMAEIPLDDDGAMFPFEYYKALLSIYHYIEHPEGGIVGKDFYEYEAFHDLLHILGAYNELYDSIVVGNNMARVGPHQRGQILLRPH